MSVTPVFFAVSTPCASVAWSIAVLASVARRSTSAFATAFSSAVKPLSSIASFLAFAARSMAALASALMVDYLVS